MRTTFVPSSKRWARTSERPAPRTGDPSDATKHQGHARLHHPRHRRRDRPRERHPARRFRPQGPLRVVDTGGWLSGRKVLLSTAWLSAVAPRQQALVVNLTKKRIEEAPPYDPDVEIPREYETQLHDHYGYPYTW